MMNIWQMLLGIAMLAIAFALWTTSEATRAMLIVMVAGSGMVLATLATIMQLFQLLGECGQNPCRATLRRLLVRGSACMAACSLAFSFLLWLAIYLLINT